MLNLVTFSNVSPEMVSASSAKPLGVSSPAFGGSPNFSSALQGASAGHSSPWSSSQRPPGKAPGILVTPGETEGQKTAPGSADVANISSFNPAAASASVAAQGTPQPFDSVGNNAVTPENTLSAIAGDAVTAGLALLGVPSILANIAGDFVAGLAEHTQSTSGENESNPNTQAVTDQNAAPACPTTVTQSSSTTTSTQDQSLTRLPGADSMSHDVAILQRSIANDFVFANHSESPQPQISSTSAKTAAAPAADVSGKIAQQLPVVSGQFDSREMQAVFAPQMLPSVNPAAIGSGASVENSSAANQDGIQKISHEVLGRLQSALAAIGGRASVQSTTGSTVSALGTSEKAVNVGHTSDRDSSSQDSSGQPSNSGAESGAGACTSPASSNRFDTAVSTAAKGALENPQSATNLQSANSSQGCTPGTQPAPVTAQQITSAPQSGSPRSAGQPSGLPAAQPPIPPQMLPGSLNDVVHASELYQRVGGAEMHISMQTDVLGSIDLRAALHQSGLTATIGVQRSDVQALLSNDLPSLQHTLSDKSFRIDQISVLSGSVGNKLDLGGQRHQQAPQQSQGVAPPLGSPGGISPIESLPMTGLEAILESVQNGRLNVRA